MSEPEEVQEGIVPNVHNQYDIPESMFRHDIGQEYDLIHANIEKVHDDLINLFKEKEKELLDKYKRQMTKAQQKEKELTESTSEAELKKRMIEKKEKLQKERQKFLETSIYFSDKCKDFKKTLQNVVSTTKEYESEIQFLNEQIVYAEKHNEKLKEELDQLKDRVKSFDPNINLEDIEQALLLPNKGKLHRDLVNIKSNANSYQQKKFKSMNVSQSQDSLPIQNSSLAMKKTGYEKYVSPYSKKLMNQYEVSEDDVKRMKEELRKQKEIGEKLNEFLNDPCFQETEFEKIFLESVNNVRMKKNMNSNNNNSIASSKLPQLQNSNFTNETSIKRDNESTLDFTQISDFEFNDFGKRQILDDFLSREEIKRYLYSLIFGQSQTLQAEQYSGIQQQSGVSNLQVQQQLQQSNNSQINNQQ